MPILRSLRVLFVLVLAASPLLHAASRSTAKVVTSRLPAHVLVGYWQNFSNKATVQTLAQVPAAYTIVEVSFATPKAPFDGSISFDVDPMFATQVPGGYNAVQFRMDIQAIQKQGRFVLLSIGGAHRSFALTSAAQVTKFVQSTEAVMKEYGFNGIDIDLENVITADNYTFLEDALRQLRAKVGPGLMITMAPQTNDMNPAKPDLDNYLKIVLDLNANGGDTITMVNTQYYNSGTKRGRDGKIYSEGTIDFITAQADAVLEKLDASRVGIGVPSLPTGRGYLTPEQVNDVLDCLMLGTHCGSYIPVAKYPNLRGAMTWSTNWDAANGNRMSTVVGQHLAAMGPTAAAAGK